MQIIISVAVAWGLTSIAAAFALGPFLASCERRGEFAKRPAAVRVAARQLIG